MWLRISWLIQYPGYSGMPSSTDWIEIGLCSVRPALMETSLQQIALGRFPVIAGGACHPDGNVAARLQAAQAQSSYCKCDQICTTRTACRGGSDKLCVAAAHSFYVVQVMHVQSDVSVNMSIAQENACSCQPIQKDLR